MRILGVFASLLAVALVACGDEAGIGTSEDDVVATPPPRAWTPAPTKAGNLRVATLNVRNFPRDELSPIGVAEGEAAPAAAAPSPTKPSPLVRKQTDTDEAMLLDLLATLDFDVLALQEVNDAERFDALLARLAAQDGRAYASAYAANAVSGNIQKVGLVVRADRARLEAPEEHADIDVRGTLRAGLSARVASLREGGADFDVLVLHLASGDSVKRATLRADQGEVVARTVLARQGRDADRDFVVLGDFNSARGDAELAGPAGLDAVLAGGGTGLSRLVADLPCTSYYTKSPTNPLLQPSVIDQVYLASLGERDESVPLSVGGHCYERTCAPFVSASPETGTTYWGVTDHCPVYFELRDEDAD